MIASAASPDVPDSSRYHHKDAAQRLTSNHLTDRFRSATQSDFES